MAGALEDELGGLSGGALVDLQGAQGVFAQGVPPHGVVEELAKNGFQLLGRARLDSAAGL